MASIEAKEEVVSPSSNSSRGEKRVITCGLDHSDEVFARLKKENGKLPVVAEEELLLMQNTSRLLETLHLHRSRLLTDYALARKSKDSSKPLLDADQYKKWISALDDDLRHIRTIAFRDFKTVNKSEFEEIADDQEKKEKKDRNTAEQQNIITKKQKQELSEQVKELRRLYADFEKKMQNSDRQRVKLNSEYHRLGTEIEVARVELIKARCENQILDFSKNQLRSAAGDRATDLAVLNNFIAEQESRLKTMINTNSEEIENLESKVFNYVGYQQLITEQLRDAARGISDTHAAKLKEIFQEKYDKVLEAEILKLGNDVQKKENIFNEKRTTLERKTSMIRRLLSKRRKSGTSILESRFALERKIDELKDDKQFLADSIEDLEDRKRRLETKKHEYAKTEFELNQKYSEFKRTLADYKKILQEEFAQEGEKIFHTPVKKKVLSPAIRGKRKRKHHFASGSNISLSSKSKKAYTRSAAASSSSSSTSSVKTVETSSSSSSTIMLK